MCSDSGAINDSMQEDFQGIEKGSGGEDNYKKVQEQRAYLIWMRIKLITRPYLLGVYITLWQAGEDKTMNQHSTIFHPLQEA